MISIDDFFSLNAWPEFKNVVKTPNIDLFSSSASTFTSAFSEVALCNPSRSAVLTGRGSWETGIVENSTNLFDVVPSNQVLFAELRDMGYHITLGGKVFHSAYDPHMEDFADVILRQDGFRNGVVDEELQINEVSYGASGDLVLSDSQLAAQIVQVLGEEQTEPFVIAAGIYRPHADWIVPQEYFDLYDPATLPIPYFGDPNDEADFYYALTGSSFHKQVVTAGVWQDLIHAYLASVSYADAMFGQMIAALDASAHADDTAVVLWSDHGYHLGDRGIWHKFTLWEEAARAPLIIRTPGQTVPLVIDTVVSLPDIHATIMELAGGVSNFSTQSQSLVPLLEGRLADFDAHGALTWMYGGISYRTETYRYIREEDGSEKFYNILQDPHQLHNLIADPQLAAAIQSHRDAIPALVASHHLQFGGAGDDSLVGTSGDDLFILGAGSDTAIGGDGDDTYIVRGAAAITELAGGGYDKVIVVHSTVMADNVEDLIAVVDSSAVGVFGIEITGNSSANTISATMWRDQIWGLGGNDAIISGVGNDTVYGGDGGDTLYGAGADDLLFGGSGDDLLSGSTDNDTLYGDDGNDTLYGGAQFDTLYGGSGDDYLEAVGGDKLYGDAGNDTLSLTFGISVGYGGDGDDRLVNQAGRSTLDGGAGDDVLYGGSASDTLLGGAGNDLLDGGAGIDRLQGGLDDDRYYIDNPRDVIVEVAGQGNDSLYAAVDYTLAAQVSVEHLFVQGTAGRKISGNDLANAVTGGIGHDTLIGGAGNDALDGGAGNDRLQGGFDDDRYYVDSARDVIVEEAGQGHDRLYASVDYTLAARVSVEEVFAVGSSGRRLAGNELANSIFGGIGNDTLLGGAGNDLLDGGAGNDRLQGGLDDDRYYVDSARDVIVEVAGQGDDSLYAAVDYTLAAQVSVEHLFVWGTAGRKVSGNDLANVVTGGIGNDTLMGGAGDDTLNGGAGNDMIDGGLGLDQLAGGSGTDSFVFKIQGDVDTVTDFAADRLRFDASEFMGMSALGTGALSAGEFALGAATAASGQFIYVQSAGALYFDADGTGADAGYLVANITNAAALKAAWIVLF